MASSAVEICNEALALVGAAPIASLSEQTVAGQLLNRLYTTTRDELLVSHPWKFAKMRVILNVDATAPAFDYAYRYQLPSDCLRVIETSLGTEARWTIENGYFLCDASSTVGIAYVSRVTTEATFSTPFCEALAHKLASKIAYPLVQSSTLADQMFRLYLVHLKDARAMNAQEGGSIQIEANDWLYSRY